ncbi:MAG: acyl carrier protein [Xanthomonadaceae bacterium]|nr:acyl carrier protein [Xanthomonadaceae bacterium]
MTREQLLQRIAAILQDTFDIEPDRVRLDARLGEDLDIDSIDAVDLIVQLKPLIGSSLKPEAFKSVRTVADVVEAVYAMMHAGDEVPAGI